jgi:soluble cytochrome b562
MRRRRHSLGLGTLAGTSKPARELQRQLQAVRAAIRNGKCNAAIEAMVKVSELAGQIKTSRTSKALDRLLAKYANGVKFACTC